MQYKIDWPQRFGQPKPKPSRIVSSDGKVTDHTPDLDWAMRLSVGEVIDRVSRQGAVVEATSASCKPL